MTSIHAVTLAWREVTVPHFRSVLHLLRTPGLSYAVQAGDALITRARAQAASRFLEDTNKDVLLMLDSDIEFETDDALRICAWAVSHDVVGGLYACRSRENPKPSSILPPNIDARFWYDNGHLVPAEYLATGFLAVHRRVFETLSKDLPLYHPKDFRFWPFFDPCGALGPDGEPIQLSEDFAFCLRARERGFGLHLDPRVRLKHWGAHPFTLEDLAQRPLPEAPITLTRSSGGYGYVVQYGDDTAPPVADPAREPAVA